MFEHGRAVMVDMSVELDRGTAAREHLGETLLAVDQFLIPQIVTLKLDQVERDQRDVMIAATAPQGVSRTVFHIDQKVTLPPRPYSLRALGSWARRSPPPVAASWSA